MKKDLFYIVGINIDKHKIINVAINNLKNNSKKMCYKLLFEDRNKLIETLYDIFKKDSIPLENICIKVEINGYGLSLLELIEKLKDIIEIQKIKMTSQLKTQILCNANYNLYPTDAELIANYL